MSNILKKIFPNTEIPIWLMRQAGRYLPEYRESRKKAKNFLDLCYSPDLVREVTLQPISRFNLDAAIIFSDILVIPDAIGMNVEFHESIGPILKKITNIGELASFQESNYLKNLQPVYEGIVNTKAALPKGKPLIGFIGAPWTIASYMIEGKGSKTFNEVKDLAYNNKAEFEKIIELLIECSIIHIKQQIKAGVDLVQIFDSWSGVLDENNFEQWVIKPTQKIIKEVKKQYPDIPIIGFPKGAGIYYKNYIEKTNLDIISIDSNLSSSWIKENISQDIVTQGNLDPLYLLTKDKSELEDNIMKILYTFQSYDHIFNLGHGILPSTPIENVEFLIKTIRSYEKENRRNSI